MSESIPGLAQFGGGHSVIAKSETTGTEMRVAISCEYANQIMEAQDKRSAALEAFHTAAQSGAESFLAQTGYSDSKPHSLTSIARLMEDYAQLRIAALEAQSATWQSRYELEERNKLDYIQQVETLEAQVRTLQSLLNTPEVEDFDKGVPLEAAHQVLRWGAEHDAGKNPEDWFWLIGYLAGKALAAHKAGNNEKAKHHCISTSAALRNWHAHIRSGESVMRPGIAETAALAATEPKP